jgi:hypothetical protein
VGIRPLDSPRRESVRKIPFYLCRQSRISRVLPVGVPSLFHRERQGHTKRASRFDGFNLNDQLGMNMVRGGIYIQTTKKQKKAACEKKVWCSYQYFFHQELI